MLARESVSAFRAKPTMQGKGAGVLCLQMTPSGYDIVVLSPQCTSLAQDRQFDRSQERSTAMKSMLASMAVVLTFCAAPAAAAEFPKTGSAEYDTYYVDTLWQKSIAEPARGQSLTPLESPAMSKEKARSMTCLFAASDTGARWERHFTSTGAALKPTKMVTTYSRPSTTTTTT